MDARAREFTNAFYGDYLNAVGAVTEVPKAWGEYELDPSSLVRNAFLRSTLTYVEFCGERVTDELAEFAMDVYCYFDDEVSEWIYDMNANQKREQIFNFIEAVGAAEAKSLDLLSNSLEYVLSLCKVYDDAADASTQRSLCGALTRFAYLLIKTDSVITKSEENFYCLFKEGLTQALTAGAQTTHSNDISIASSEETSISSVSPEEELKRITKEIECLIGLDNIKREVTDLLNMLRVQQMRRNSGLTAAEISKHMVFYGNPGTGKTTIARKLAEIYRVLGVLSKGHFIETDRSSLVAGYLGQTAIKTTEVLERAKGGILFIDEAYTLSPGLDGDEFGQEAIDTILAFMENHREDIVVIAAGYTEEMGDFVNSNPGLKSRFNTFIHFDDYSPDEMKKIFLSMAYADRYVVHGICDAGLDEIFSRLSSRSGKGFGNGREVRNIYEKTLVLQNRRLMALATIDRNQLVEILPCDLPLQTNTSKSNESKGLRTDTQRIAIGKLVGINVVKQEISRIIDMARVSKVRAEAGLPLVTPSLHMVFTGSPGTGKTTVARCLAQELYDMGVMARNQVVEVSRSELVAGYVGQTAIKTTKVLDTALGGILFIDEAYSLNQNKGGSADPFGLEAIDTILKYMEDNKESIMVIAAGYKEEMSDFLESNTGLKSRFNRFIHFPDYSDAELFIVFKSMAKNNQYVIREDALDLVAHAIGMLRIRQGEKFSNARAVRNLFEKTIENQASRLVRSNQLSREEIEMIIPEDVSPLIDY